MKRILTAAAVSFIAGALLGAWILGKIRPVPKTDPEEIVIVTESSESVSKPDTTYSVTPPPEHLPIPVIIPKKDILPTADSSTVVLQPEVKVSSGKTDSGIEYTFTHSGIGTQIYDMSFKAPLIERRIVTEKQREGWTMSVTGGGMLTDFSKQAMSAHLALQFEYTKGRFHIAPFAGASYSWSPQSQQFRFRPAIGVSARIDICHLN